MLIAVLLLPDLEDNEGRKSIRKRATRRKYGPRKARNFNPMDDFEVPVHCQIASA